MESSFVPEAVRQFSNPEQEVAFLREQLAERERALMERQPDIDTPEHESLGRQELRDYSTFTPKAILHPEYELAAPEVAAAVHTVEVASDPVAEILNLAREKGIRNALSVLEKTSNAYVIDEVHRKLIEEIKCFRILKWLPSVTNC